MTDTSPDAATRRICVICNEGSGRNRREADAIHAAMEVLGPGADLRQVRGEDIGGAARAGRLRHDVPRWLALPPLSAHVLQVAAAHRRHGGEGALYVYLRAP